MTEPSAWKRCTVGSCHRHQACMYTPCRTVAQTDQMTEPSERVSALLMEAADYFAETLAVADPRAWQHLLVYVPADLLADKVREMPMTDPSDRVSGPCNRVGCGTNRACSRPDCPILMIEASGGGWYWETREEVRRQMRKHAERAK